MKNKRYKIEKVAYSWVLGAIIQITFTEELPQIKKSILCQ